MLDLVVPCAQPSAGGDKERLGQRRLPLQLSFFSSAEEMELRTNTKHTCGFPVQLVLLT